MPHDAGDHELNPQRDLLPWLWMLVPLVGSVAYNPQEGKDYKWYISGIYCHLGDYMLPTSF